VSQVKSVQKNPSGATYSQEISAAAEMLRETARRAPREVWKATIAAPTSLLDYFRTMGPETALMMADVLDCFNPAEESGHEECPPHCCPIASMVTLARKINGSLS
jgi:hypothetical protein